MSRSQVRNTLMNLCLRAHNLCEGCEINESLSKSRVRDSTMDMCFAITGSDDRQLREMLQLSRSWVQNSYKDFEFYSKVLELVRDMKVLSWSQVQNELMDFVFGNKNWQKFLFFLYKKRACS